MRAGSLKQVHLPSYVQSAKRKKDKQTSFNGGLLLSLHIFVRSSRHRICVRLPFWDSLSLSLSSHNNSCDLPAYQKDEKERISKEKKESVPPGGIGRTQRDRSFSHAALDLLFPRGLRISLPSLLLSFSRTVCNLSNPPSSSVEKNVYLSSLCAARARTPHQPNLSFQGVSIWV
mmetsp:Transcript_16198/g.32800  ORF Transcript_16198/g.32800 Transcript_16198/m.32800 type:complete len:174 (+) Transcript_16198:147-668(+)